MPKAVWYRHTLQRNPWIQLTMNSKLLGTTGSCWVQRLESATFSQNCSCEGSFRPSVEVPSKARDISDWSCVTACLWDQWAVGAVGAGVSCFFPSPVLHILAYIQWVNVWWLHGSDHIEDKPLSTDTKICRNRPGSFSTYLVNAVIWS